MKKSAEKHASSSTPRLWRVGFRGVKAPQFTAVWPQAFDVRAGFTGRFDRARALREHHAPRRLVMDDSARNLACHRAARSVWEKRGWSGVTIEERVGPWAVSLAGAALIVAGARRRSWTGAHLAIGGAMLIACAAAGLCNPRHAAMRWRSLT
jgi:hypothetical protein